MVSIPPFPIKILCKGESILPVILLERSFGKLKIRQLKGDLSVISGAGGEKAQSWSVDIKHSYWIL
jgi:hypothetical protein